MNVDEDLHRDRYRIVHHGRKHAHDAYHIGHKEHGQSLPTVPRHPVECRENPLGRRVQGDQDDRGDQGEAQHDLQQM